MTKLMMRNKCISFAGHFDGCADVWVQCCLYCLMQHVQGYTRSLWTPPSGYYLLRIALAATRATGNTATMKKCTHFAGHFDGPGGALVQYSLHRTIEEVQGFTRSQWTPPLGKYCSQ
jgi:hypothetical protein